MKRFPEWTGLLLVDDDGGQVPHAQRLVGPHSFNLPHQIPLIEVVATGHVSPKKAATLCLEVTS